MSLKSMIATLVPHQDDRVRALSHLDAMTLHPSWESDGMWHQIMIQPAHSDLLGIVTRESILQ
jgi:hypothetical protein